ncbi:uncharacterized protein LOC125500777 isoform X2 [Athalia rosae]|uniref:uncharacterized protein LOC125500777 isoform X2 n=1 Tax=Athalia rosae TaxID=37344 RepID=UPI002033FA4D|nr:uncharacterized protein LOC125500777 isoform X2 [Athalia rosae]
MNKDEFYLTLPSNSSMRYFGDNTTTKYTTQLPRQIELTGEWKVALVEVQYPTTLQTVTAGSNTVRLHQHISPKPADLFDDIPKSKDNRVTAHVLRIQPGVYTGIEQIVRALSGVSLLAKHFEFGYAGIAKDRIAVTRICGCTTGHYLSFSPGLYQQLGFTKVTQNIVKTLEADHPYNVTAGMPAQMFVYCDITEPRIVGDVYAPLLRIVQTNGKDLRHGSSETKTLSPPHYLPLLNSNFRTIDIDIRDQLRRPLPFTHGTLTVTLRFRRIH